MRSLVLFFCATTVVGDDGWRAPPAARGPFTNSMGSHRPPTMWPALAPRRPHKANAVVESGLRLLARRQRAGAWHNSGGADVQTSALCLLAFVDAGLAAPRAPRNEPAHPTVAAGMRWLLAQQRTNGQVGATPTAHAIASLVLTRVYTRTRCPRYKQPAQTALYWLARARTRFAGWGNKPRPTDSTIEATLWGTLATVAARGPNLERDPDAVFCAQAWLAKQTAPPAQPFPSATARITRALAYGKGDPLPPDLPLIAALQENLPTTAAPSLTYWYAGTHALFKSGGEPWQLWRTALLRAIRSRQRADGLYGSSLNSAFCLLSLQVATGYTCR